MNLPYKIGRLPDERTARSGVDSVLLAQAFWRDDMQAVETILRHMDPYSVALQLCGWLFATFRQHGVNVEERLAVWLAACREQEGQ
ncbi:Hypothetical protein MUW33_2788 [Mycobacterium canetti]|uniref:hypothetical protein n=1 Tax=Mycobacterium canetti TaxID=78331 RepID=UPI002D76B28D|nr:hypothetical protein [Mycobacterium canetti]WRO42738.1 Hypothetical protein MUW33_2788 [Mycobacterium canetti]